MSLVSFTRKNPSLSSSWLLLVLKGTNWLWLAFLHSAIRIGLQFGCVHIYNQERRRRARISYYKKKRKKTRSISHLKERKEKKRKKEGIFWKEKKDKKVKKRRKDTRNKTQFIKTYLHFQIKVWKKKKKKSLNAWQVLEEITRLRNICQNNIIYMCIHSVCVSSSYSVLSQNERLEVLRQRVPLEPPQSPADIHLRCHLLHDEQWRHWEVITE